MCGKKIMTGAAQSKCGFVALIGAPNAGKSTLINTLVGTKVSIVSDKPQTTRTTVQGVLTKPGLATSTRILRPFNGLGALPCSGLVFRSLIKPPPGVSMQIILWEIFHIFFNEDEK